MKTFLKNRGCEMRQRMCTRCCQPITKSGLKDPYLCRECEKDSENNQHERFACIDKRH